MTSHQKSELPLNAFINEAIETEPFTFLFMVFVHVFVFFVYGCFIRQIFIKRPIIELYEHKIRIYPVFGFKPCDIDINKIINIEFQPHSFTQKGRFAVRVAKKEEIKQLWRDTKMYNADMAYFKNPSYEIESKLKKYKTIFEKAHEESKL